MIDTEGPETIMMVVADAQLLFVLDDLQSAGAKRDDNTTVLLPRNPRSVYQKNLSKRIFLYWSTVVYSTLVFCTVNVVPVREAVV